MSTTSDWSDDPRLVAYALGELDGDDRAEVERALAEDPACRAALDELAAFLPEVERAVRIGAADEGLDRAAHEEIASAARRGPRRRTSVVLGPVLAAAAATALVALGGWQALRITSERSAPEVVLEASLDRAAESEPATRRRQSRSAKSVRDRAVAAPEAERSPRFEASASETESLSEPGEGAVRGLESQAVVDELRLQALGYSGEALDEDEVDSEVAFSDTPSIGEARESIAENAFVLTESDPLSTFSIDVDTASYASARGAITSGRLPAPEDVRIEEFVNYFSYDDPAPAADDPHPFRVTVQTGGAPWAPEHRIVRIGLKARPIDLGERAPANLVFLVDVSGSMNQPDKLPLVQDALATLTDALDPDDRVAIVVYASAEGLALPSTPVEAREAILQSLERLEAGGSTNGGAGIELAYAIASEHFVEGGTNRVVLCTDGDFNVGVTSDEALEELIAEKAASGIDLTVLGFGSGNFQDEKMERLSNRGNGNFAFIDSSLEAEKALATEVGGTLHTVARDVKVQVVWNPARVRAARLIGYENRMLEHEDFLDDAKDAGEIGAGHGVTALFEVVPWGRSEPGLEVSLGRPNAAALDAAGGAAPTGPFVTVRVRYIPPGEDRALELVATADDPGTTFDGAPAALRFAASVAAFGMVLRGSEFAGETTLQDARRWALEALGDDPGGLRAGFVELVEKAIDLDR
ncbi:MAG: von Willebrand factor type A domain-containing protein [Planctomycetota bacterium]